MSAEDLNDTTISSIGNDESLNEAFLLDDVTAPQFYNSTTHSGGHNNNEDQVDSSSSLNFIEVPRNQSEGNTTVEDILRGTGANILQSSDIKQTSRNITASSVPNILMIMNDTSSTSEKSSSLSPQIKISEDFSTCSVRMSSEEKLRLEAANVTGNSGSGSNNDKTETDQTLGLDDLSCSLMCTNSSEGQIAHEQILRLTADFIKRDELIEGLATSLECTAKARDDLRDEKENLLLEVDKLKEQLSTTAEEKAKLEEVAAKKLDETSYLVLPDTSFQTQKQQQQQLQIETKDGSSQTNIIKLSSVGISTTLPPIDPVDVQQNCVQLQQTAKSLHSELDAIKLVVKESLVSFGRLDLTDLVERSLESFQLNQMDQLANVKKEYSQDIDYQNKLQLELKEEIEKVRKEKDSNLKEKQVEIDRLKNKITRLEETAARRLLNNSNASSERKQTQSQQQLQQHQQHSLSSRLSPEGSELDIYISLADSTSISYVENVEAHYNLTRTKMNYLQLTPPVECIDDGEIIERSTSSEVPNSVVEDLKLQLLDLEKKFEANKRYLEDQTREREEESDEFQRVTHDLERRMDDLRKEKERLETIISHQKSELEDCEIRLQYAIESQQDLANKSERLEDDLKSAADKLCQLHDIIRDLEGQIDSATTNVGTLQDQNEFLELELEKTIVAHKEELEAIKMEKEQVNLASDMTEELQSQVQDLTNRLERKLQEMDNFQWTRPGSSLSASTEDVSIREFASHTNRATVCSPKQMFPIIADGLRRLDSHFESLVQFEEVIIRKLQDAELRCSNAKKSIEEIEKEKEVTQNTIREQIKKIADLEGRLDQIRYEPSPNAVTLTGLRARVTKLNEEVEEYKGKLQLRELEAQELTSRLAAAQALLNQYNSSSRSPVSNPQNPKVTTSSQTEPVNKSILKNSPMYTNEACVQTKPSESKRKTVYFDQPFLDLSSIPGETGPIYSTPNIDDATNSNNNIHESTSIKRRVPARERPTREEFLDGSESEDDNNTVLSAEVLRERYNNNSGIAMSSKGKYSKSLGSLTLTPHQSHLGSGNASGLTENDVQNPFYSGGDNVNDGSRANGTFSRRDVSIADSKEDQIRKLKDRVDELEDLLKAYKSACPDGDFLLETNVELDENGKPITGGASLSKKPTPEDLANMSAEDREYVQTIQDLLSKIDQDGHALENMSDSERAALAKYLRSKAGRGDVTGPMSSFKDSDGSEVYTYKVKTETEYEIEPNGDLTYIGSKIISANSGDNVSGGSSSNRPDDGSGGSGSGNNGSGGAGNNGAADTGFKSGENSHGPNDWNTALQESAARIAETQSAVALETLKTQLNMAEQAHVKQTQTIKDLQQQLANAEGDVFDDDGKPVSIIQLKQELQNVQNQLQQEQAKVNELSTQLTQNAQQNGYLELVSCQEMLKHRQRELDAMTDEMCYFKSQFDKLSDQLAQRNVACSALEQHVHTLQQKLDERLRAEQQLSGQLSEVMPMLDDLQEQKNTWLQQQDQNLMRIFELQSQLRCALEELQLMQNTQEHGYRNGAVSSKHAKLYAKIKSCKRALIWQKNYLTQVIIGYKCILRVRGSGREHPDYLQKAIPILPTAIGLLDNKRPIRRFKIAAAAIIAIFRWKFMVRRWDHRGDFLNNSVNSVSSEGGSTIIDNISQVSQVDRTSTPIPRISSNSDSHANLILSPPTRDDRHVENNDQQNNNNAQQGRRQSNKPSNRGDYETEKRKLSMELPPSVDSSKITSRLVVEPSSVVSEIPTTSSSSDVLLGRLPVSDYLKRFLYIENQMEQSITRHTTHTETETT